MDSPIRRRAIISCTIARPARCRGKKPCRWRRLAKPRTFRCTHCQSLLPSRVRRSAIIRSTSACAHLPTILLHTCVATKCRRWACEKRSALLAKILFREFSCPCKQVEKFLDSAAEFYSVGPTRPVVVHAFNNCPQFLSRSRRERLKFC